MSLQKIFAAMEFLPFALRTDQKCQMNWSLCDFNWIVKCESVRDISWHINDIHMKHNVLPRTFILVLRWSCCKRSKQWIFICYILPSLTIMIIHGTHSPYMVNMIHVWSFVVLIVEVSNNIYVYLWSASTSTYSIM